MPPVRANGIEIWYDILGPAGAPVLALSHGWLGPTEYWPPGVLDRLAERLRVLVYDVRGHGKTTAPEDVGTYSMPAYAADLAAVLDAAGIERAHIGGVSQGGMISAQFAVDFPHRTRSLLICDSTAGNGLDEGAGGEWERGLQAYCSWMIEYAREHGTAALAEERIRQGRENDPHYFEFPVPQEQREARDRERHARMSPHAFEGTCSAIRDRPDLTGRLRELSVPVLVVGGEWDNFYPCSERDHRLIEGSRFVRVERCGHASPDWRPNAFDRAVGKFIADVEAGREAAGEQTL
jgi:pimeloyl-ACP methyl ester carboxylesterase